jgi:hypothetical protein
MTWIHFAGRIQQIYEAVTANTDAHRFVDEELVKHAPLLPAGRDPKWIPKLGVDMIFSAATPVKGRKLYVEGDEFFLRRQSPSHVARQTK